MIDIRKCTRCGDLFYGNAINYEYCPRCMQDNIEINRLRDAGHTLHCACNMVMGDGMCTCSQSGISRQEQAENIIEILIKNKF